MMLLATHDPINLLGILSIESGLVACPVFLSSLFESYADPGYLPLNWWLASFGAVFEYFLERQGD